jgi:hypothetical protein
MTKSSPAARAALDEASRRWPQRGRASDGILGDESHRSRALQTYHCAYGPGHVAMEYGNVPAAYGYALAFDLDHDPAHGCDAHAIARWLVATGDPRVVKAISQRKIWSRHRASEGWRPYSGSNRHDHHAHISIDPHRWSDTSPWFDGFGKAPSKPAPAKPKPQGAPRPPAKTTAPKPTYDISNIIGQALSPHPRAIPGVKATQARLNAVLGTKLTCDGIWGAKIEAAYAQFQRSLGYKGKDANGKPGTVSLRKLHAGHNNLAV